MNKKLVKTGIICSTITAICCFTPLLVWMLGLVGLAALASYLDYVLLPVLVGFVVLIMVGLQRKESTDKDTTP